jgi:anti-sigma B factor antagonist
MSGFSARTRQFDDVTVVDVRGRMTSMEGDAIHELLLEILADGRRKIVLNLRDVSYLDSSGLGSLVRCLLTSRKHAAELKAVDLSPRTRELLKLANLELVLADFPSEQAALDSFSG